MHDKTFDCWNREKKRLHNRGVLRTINEGEVWWCGVGQNIGVEINGKSESFTRPVLIIKKLGKIGTPLTSKTHEGNWYVSFVFKNKTQTAVLSQTKMFSVFRLHKRMGRVPNSDLVLIKNGILNLIK